MLSEKQINEIRGHLDRAQNPLFYYDNDADGLCSFLIFRKFLGIGKGVAIMSYPDLNKEYARKARELNADCVFVLDKPLISQEFVNEVIGMGIPLVWIDHHDMDCPISEASGLYIYNVAKNVGVDKSDEPVSYLAQKICGKKEDIWISIMGCISDHYMPDFAKEFARKYPELWNKKAKKSFDVYFGTEIGKIALALNFGLMDSTTHIVGLQKYLLNCSNPSEVLAESKENSSFRAKYGEINKKYENFVRKAEENTDGKLIFFEYGGDLSISSEIANYLNYKYPKKYIVVAFRKGNVANISARGKNVRAILERVLKDVKGGGGGHKDAVGARIDLIDLGKFRQLFEEVL